MWSQYVSFLMGRHMPLFIRPPCPWEASYSLQSEEVEVLAGAYAHVSSSQHYMVGFKAKRAVWQSPWTSLGVLLRRTHSQVTSLWPPTNIMDNHLWQNGQQPDAMGMTIRYWMVTISYIFWAMNIAVADKCVWWIQLSNMSIQIPNLALLLPSVLYCPPYIQKLNHIIECKMWEALHL